MLLFSAAQLLLTVLCHISSVTAGEIPVINGVIGDVPVTATAPSALKVGPNPPPTTPGKLRVTENSGVCETTPGVYQASGYGDIAADKSLWFWYFAARNNPSTAPLALWLNGGPGSSSMIGLFQELGPCRITNDSSGVTLNPTSWNNVANSLFIDQPVGVGFSHGTEEVSTSQQAAADVWTFLQIFFADPRFAKLAQNDFAIWTESYGGHYGPTFAAYFLEQNAAIASGSISGIPINLKVLGVGDGLTDPLVQYPGYITYSQSNSYHPLVSTATTASANKSWFSNGGCMEQITNCYNTETNSACSKAQSFCNKKILSPLAGNWDVYYIPTANPDPYPPQLNTYLGNTTLMQQIGAESSWTISNFDVYRNFASTGDWMHNSRPNLETVINAGVRTIIYDGDADYILNFYGVEAMVNALQTKFTSEYQAQQFTDWTVAGQKTGIYKNAGTFSYVRIFGAGHEVPAYTFGTLGVGQAALQMFTQIMSNQPISST